MKLATLKDGTRDGQLAVVARDLKSAVLADGIAPTLQRALDDWNFIAPQLEQLYSDLNDERARHAFEFDPKRCMAPLPRAFQWADGSAYVNHVELVRRARNAEMPESFWHDPLMYQGGSDDFLGPTDDIVLGSAEWGIDFEGEVAVITGDVPMQSAPEAAAQQIRLLMLVNDVSLRNLIPAELAKGFGFLQSKPATAFSPVAVTPDELGGAWQDGKVHLPLLRHLERRAGRQTAGRGRHGVQLPATDRASGQDAQRARRLDHRFRHCFQQGCRQGLYLHRGKALPGNDCRRRAEDALHAVRRHHQAGNAGCERQVDIWRHRPDRGAACGRRQGALSA